MKAFSIPLNFRHGLRLVRSPKIKIPKEIEVPIFLIRHELQSRMLFKHFQMINVLNFIFPFHEFLRVTIRGFIALKC